MGLRAQDLLTRHTAPVAQFLNLNYERFFDGYTELLQSENYVTRRQSLKVLRSCPRPGFTDVAEICVAPCMLLLCLARYLVVDVCSPARRNGFAVPCIPGGILVPASQYLRCSTSSMITVKPALLLYTVA